MFDWSVVFFCYFSDALLFFFCSLLYDQKPWQFHTDLFLCTPLYILAATVRSINNRHTNTSRTSAFSTFMPRSPLLTNLCIITCAVNPATHPHVHSFLHSLSLVLSLSGPD